MGEVNEGRLLPWLDTAECDARDFQGFRKCHGPMVPVAEMPNGYSGPQGSRIACAACGEARVGTEEDVRRTMRSARAFRMLEAGEIHDDRGCARCNGPLLLDRQRLCAECVEKDNAERQVPLFPGVGHA